MSGFFPGSDYPRRDTLHLESRRGIHRNGGNTPMLIFKGHKNRLRCLAISPDGSLLASAAGKGRAISLWDTRRGKRIRFLSWHTAVPKSLTFSPGGDLLASIDKWNQLQF